MSTFDVKAFYDEFPLKVTEQTMEAQAKRIIITVAPKESHRPVCQRCRQVVESVHSFDKRSVRDLNMFTHQVVVHYGFRTVRCKACGIVTEDLGLVKPYSRITRRLAAYVLELCNFMTITDVAKHLKLNWKTVKDIHKEALKTTFKEVPTEPIRILAVDEISIRKGHRYLTVVLNWESGQVVWVGEDRRCESFKAFFESLSRDVRAGIQAVAMDMWDPFIKATSECVPQAAIVFDQFHVVKAFGKIIDQVRNAEYRKATGEGKEVIKDTKYLLLKNRCNLHSKDKPRLRTLLQMNQSIHTAYLLKDMLKKLWRYRSRAWCQRALHEWCEMAIDSKIPALKKFAKTLKRFAYGILNHCQFQIHTSRLEGVNNKIKVIKRKGYGFTDLQYFILLIKNAFVHSN